MNFSESLDVMKNWLSVGREHRFFFIFLFLSFFLWSFDAVSTNYLVSRFGISVESNAKAAMIYETFGHSALSVFTFLNIMFHSFLVVLYRKAQLVGWFAMITALAATIFTNMHNMLLSGWFF